MCEAQLEHGVEERHGRWKRIHGKYVQSGAASCFEGFVKWEVVEEILLRPSKQGELWKNI